MRKVWWKQLFSYIWPIQLEILSSDYHEQLEVLLTNGRYQLCTEKAIYSYGDLYSNFNQAFSKLNFYNWHGKKVLILGLGLGSIPTLLEKVYQLDCEYTIIEIDDTVIYLANKYTLPFIESSFEIIQADAFAYVLQTSETFDLICMDIFVDDVIPSKFEGIPFLEALEALCKADGVVLYNRLGLLESDREKTNAFFEQSFKKVFEEGRIIDVGRNLMLVSK
ncbi:MAG: hypothetical protein AAFO07_34080 [Bacteroidota bacterium]